MYLGFSVDVGKIRTAIIPDDLTLHQLFEQLANRAMTGARDLMHRIRDGVETIMKFLKRVNHLVISFVYDVDYTGVDQICQVDPPTNPLILKKKSTFFLCFFYC